ncbi:unnamed protein product [Amoebophrya sp. A25]|nr:unnamed protein product [Amoebophrya sp. A25]|eukprot:GSA25T00005037001.1
MRMPAGDRNTQILYGKRGREWSNLPTAAAINYQRRPSSSELRHAVDLDDAAPVPAVNYHKLYFGKKLRIRNERTTSSSGARVQYNTSSSHDRQEHAQDIDIKQTTAERQNPNEEGLRNAVDFGNFRIDAGSIEFDTQADAVAFAQRRLCHWVHAKKTGSIDICTAQEWDVVTSFIKEQGHWRDCTELSRMWQTKISPAAGEKQKAHSASSLAHKKCATPGGVEPRKRLEMQATVSRGPMEEDEEHENGGASRRPHDEMRKANMYMDVGGNLGACVFDMLTEIRALDGVLAFEFHSVNLFRMTSTLPLLRMPYELRRKVMVFAVGMGRTGGVRLRLHSEPGNLGNSVVQGSANHVPVEQEIAAHESFFIKSLDSF